MQQTATAGKKNGRPPSLNVVGLHDFLARKLPPRESILAPWLPTQSLTEIYSWRGVGKTWVSLNIAYAVASAGSFLNWTCEKARKVVFVDGEMPAAALQERLAAIVAATEKEPQPGMLQIITPDLQAAAMPDLATIEGQDELDQVIGDAELIILDNLSCLVRRGGRENEAESWLTVAEWALAKRAQGKSVLFIHHAGKNGQQRGTSKREDLLDAVIALKRPPDYSPADGAVFEIVFEKARNLHGSDVAPFEARLTDVRGRQVWALRTLEASTEDKVIERANDGLSQSEIARELGCNRSTVSRAYRSAKAKGLIRAN